MAKVINQRLPVEGVEETLDPPIEFIKTYRRALTEDINDDRMPSNEGIVSYTKKDTRPATRNTATPGPSTKSKAHRREFSDCEDCWRGQPPFDENIDPCHSAGSRHYMKPWSYIPGAKHTAFNKFMSDCLNWKVAHPGTKYPRCEDLQIDPDTLRYCPGDPNDFEVKNGNNPAIAAVDAGEITGPLQWTPPEDYEDCPETVIIQFTDTDGRKGCAIATREDEAECKCQKPYELEILFATSAMLCSESQVLSVDPEAPGFPPYEWDLTGGGSLSTLKGESTVYTAPETNPNCVGNAEIILTDACGKSRALHIAVNCYVPPTIAVRYCAETVGTCDCIEWYGGNCIMVGVWGVNLHRWDYDCAGNILYEEQAEGLSFSMSGDYWGTDCVMLENCSVYGVFSCPGQGCNKVRDLRTEEMKQQGCCPANPETGLPMD